MTGAAPAAVSSLMPALADRRASSRLSTAFWLALGVEAALILMLVWAASHPPGVRELPRQTEQVQLVRLPRPAQKPQPKPRREPEQPLPAPLRHVFHPRPVTLPAPEVPLPPPMASPPSPITALPAAPAPPRPEARPPLDSRATPGYLAQVRAAIQTAVQFPAAARMLRMEGRVRVRFVLRDGVVSNLRIIAPGRIAAFNSNALLAVRQAGIPLPPAALAHHVLHLELWVRFHLRRSL